MLSSVIDGYLRLILISWPAVVFILGMVLFLKFEDAVKYFIKYRMTDIGPGGIKGYAVQTQKENTSVEDAKNSEKGSTDPHLAKVKFFERLYSIIYRSQLALLLKLNSSANGITTVEASQFYLNEILKYPNYKFEDYIKFMINSSGLIKLEGDLNNGKLLITPQGKDFLS